MRKWFLAFMLVCGLAVGAFGQQQITRFALVDMGRVYAAFLQESRAARALQTRSAEVQAQIGKMAEEIQDLRERFEEAQAANNRQVAARLQADVNRKTEALRNFHATQTAALETQRENLINSNEFLSEVYAEIRFVAEREGYSMVLDLKEVPGILWYSGTVDITDNLIRSLLERRR
ncbi:MAG: OmpH family outer membrane protein [Treponema sp.]|nr:OmpH family outer membrane protein [Treponema sp.]